MTRRLVNCAAPAKLNLFLHVLGQRADGYHLLQSVFQLIDLGDLLHFSLRDDESIHRITDLPGVPATSDLSLRAASLLQTATAQKVGRLPPGVDIAIDKRLPMGGGLGGGSSDAATTLIALNYLWQAGFTRAELMALGSQLGADVPFFLFGQSAFVEGTGEQLQALPTPCGWLVVIDPGVAVATADIFSAAELTRNSKPVRMTDFSKTPEQFGRNDLQVVASARFPAVDAAINWLNTYGDARMTGSGACVFCRVSSAAQADAIVAALPSAWRGWKVQAIARHPLIDLVY